ncbi:aromatic-ring-hydroxylating dioxygenase subunit beta [Rhodococcus sp. USK13]|uniref:aromatic-ring-hydroxylating dioxygenase subunit beta n=1 Tax=Rhodococcus sp. USK13 TaxID=2806442 RepID=UPI001BD03F7A|nr:aromatic-ring-hydroxylating dioxygenase subunit beta [Rhodococcus sp. USK13]
MTNPIDLGDPRVGRAIGLVWKEAELLDDKDYPAWEGLYTADAYYVVPIDPTTEDFAASLNLVYDDATMRHARVERMMQGYSMSAVAAARTARTISRFTVVDVADDRITVRSAQIVTAFKRGTTTVVGADLTHTIHLGVDPGEDRIVRKVARLIDSEDAVGASGYML